MQSRIDSQYKFNDMIVENISNDMSQDLTESLQLIEENCKLDCGSDDKNGYIVNKF